MARFKVWMKQSTQKETVARTTTEKLKPCRVLSTR